VAIKNKSEKLRFGTVGVVNTLIDFSVLFFLKWLGIPIFVANIGSTTTAFCFSFFANKKYTFKSIGGNVKREVILFVIITLFGLWVLQTGVIFLVTQALLSVVMSDDLRVFIAKILAIIVSLIWNYTLYSRVVFKRKGDN
jgi:putative flippase GtrA